KLERRWRADPDWRGPSAGQPGRSAGQHLASRGPRFFGSERSPLPGRPAAGDESAAVPPDQHDRELEYHHAGAATGPDAEPRPDDFGNDRAGQPGGGYNVREGRNLSN